MAALDYGGESSLLRQITQQLESVDYMSVGFCLSPTDIGIPQSRPRIYILAVDRLRSRFWCFISFCKLLPVIQQAFAQFLLWAHVQLLASRRFFAESSETILAKAKTYVDAMKVEAQCWGLPAPLYVVAMCSHFLWTLLIV